LTSSAPSAEQALPVRARAYREHTTHAVTDAQKASALTPPVRPRSSEKRSGRPGCRFRSGEQTADADRDLSQVLLKARMKRKPGFRPTQPRVSFTLRHFVWIDCRCCITSQRLDHVSDMRSIRSLAANAGFAFSCHNLSPFTAPRTILPT
jgi:hypothetical protein